jgi:transposase InsO family protein
MKLIAAVTAFVAGESVNVAQVCREARTTRKSFYKWAARYRCEGLAGLEERSRRPLSSPLKTSVAVEELIIALRAGLAEHGLDAGAISIQSRLYSSTDIANDRVPSVATIHRILVRRGLVEPQPRKRPKGSWRRFEAPAPNDCWQIDATDWVIATGQVKIFNIIDDHSRVAIRCRAVHEATTSEAWTTFCQGGRHWGLPAGVLSDNGLCFSGKLRGFEVLFEANLRDAGVRPITGRPFHPQTTGKVERFQQTLKKWLRRRALARSLAELQDQLDEFAWIYNHERPHQGIGRATPISRWHASVASGPGANGLEHPIPPPTVIREVVVCNGGKVSLDGHHIGIGRRHKGATATVITDNGYASVYINNQLVRHLKIDPTRRYQGLAS